MACGSAASLRLKISQNIRRPPQLVASDRVGLLVHRQIRVTLHKLPIGEPECFGAAAEPPAGRLALQSRISGSSRPRSSPPPSAPGSTQDQIQTVVSRSSPRVQLLPPPETKIKPAH
jgi:hypothetical protein